MKAINSLLPDKTAFQKMVQKPKIFKQTVEAIAQSFSNSTSLIIDKAQIVHNPTHAFFKTQRPIRVQTQGLVTQKHCRP